MRLLNDFLWKRRQASRKASMRKAKPNATDKAMVNVRAASTPGGVSVGGIAGPTVEVASAMGADREEPVNVAASGNDGDVEVENVLGVVDA